MNILPFDQQVAVIAALCEGNSIRAVERLTGIHRDTTMRLGARVGMGAIKLHDRTVHSLQVPRIEMDEAWSYVGKKRRNVKKEDSADVGDQWVFVGMSASTKVIINYMVGKRDKETVNSFVMGLRERVINAPEISSDALHAYDDAVDLAFGTECHYGQIEKVYRAEPPKDAARRYSPGYVVAVRRRVMMGTPEQISTSYVERQNLTLRMQQRRFTRLTNGFSKKIDHHVAAVGLYVAHYNLCRVHESLRLTPALAQGITDHVWTISELVAACLANAPDEPRKRPPTPWKPRVINGGLS
jgi:IS1 family transposase